MEFAAFVILLLLSIVGFVTVYEAYVASTLDPPTSAVHDVLSETTVYYDVGVEHSEHSAKIGSTTNAVHDVSSQTDVFYDVGVDVSEHSAEIGIKQEPDTVVRVSNMDFCDVMWKNNHLASRIPTRRAIKNFCRLIQRSGDQTTGTTNVTSTLSAEELVGERHDLLAQTTNLSKLAVWCKHRDQINNYIVRKFLPDVCSNMEKEDTVAPAESTGAVRAKNVMTDSDATTEAETDVTTEATYTINQSDLLPIVCLNMHLIDAPRLAIRALNILCRMMHLSGNKKTGAMEGTSGGTQRTDLSSQTSSKLREVCTHLDQLKKFTNLSSFIESICAKIDKPDTNLPPGSLQTISLAHMTTELVATTGAVTDGAAESAYTHTPQSAATSEVPAMGVPYRITYVQVISAACQYQHLLGSPKTEFQRELLEGKCLPMECPQPRTASATEATSGHGVAQTEALDGDTSRVPYAGPPATAAWQQADLPLLRVRNVCIHFDQITNPDFKPILWIICSRLDKPGWSTQPCKLDENYFKRRFGS